MIEGHSAGGYARTSYGAMVDCEKNRCAVQSSLRATNCSSDWHRHERGYSLAIETAKNSCGSGFENGQRMIQGLAAAKSSDLVAGQSTAGKPAAKN